MDFVLNGRCGLLDQIGSEILSANEILGMHGAQRIWRDAGEDQSNILDNTICIDANPAGQQSF